MLPPLSLIVGGAASGKSAFAENLLLSTTSNLFYLATGKAGDAEMSAKISIHQARRGPRWTTLETPGSLKNALTQVPQDGAVLIDCATFWLSNFMMANRDLNEAPETFLGQLGTPDQPVVVVSNEVGQGIVPEHATARKFRDAQGRLNISLAKRADLVVQVVAGLPNVLKGKMP